MKINFDQQLQKDLLNGDQEAFTKTVELCKEFVYASAFGIVRNNHDAEDITQDVFTLLYKKRETIKSDTNIPVWLYTSSVFISKKLLRNKSTSHKHEKEIKPMKKEDSSNDELTEVVLAELSCLSLKYRDVLFRHYVLGEKYKEIAAHLGMNMSTVAMQIKRGVGKLKSNLSKKGYAVSSAIIVSIFTNPESAFANCSMSTSDIASTSLNPSTPLNVYSPGKDSVALKAYNSHSETLLASKVKSIVFIGLTLITGTYLYFHQASFEQPRNIVQPKVTADAFEFKPKIWNSKNKNLGELKATIPVNLLKVDPNTKEEYISYTGKATCYIPIPQKILSRPTKITYTFKRGKLAGGGIGNFLYNGKVPQRKKYTVSNNKLYGTDKHIGEFYIIDKSNLMIVNKSLQSITQYRHAVVDHQLVISIDNVSIYEIKVELMSDKEIQKAKKLLSIHIDKKFAEHPRQPFNPSTYNTNK